MFVIWRLVQVVNCCSIKFPTQIASHIGANFATKNLPYPIIISAIWEHIRKRSRWVILFLNSCLIVLKFRLEFQFKCDLCGRAFSQSNTLTQHQRIHTGLRPYSCIFCDKKFSVLNYLNNHLRTCKESAKSQILKSNLHANMLK